jgi:hypothetical protein
MMEDEIKVIHISITISQVEYDEIISSIEYSMAQIMGTKEILEPVRDQLYSKYGKPSWWNKSKGITGSKETLYLLPFGNIGKEANRTSLTSFEFGG